VNRTYWCLADSDWSPPTAEEEARGWRWRYRTDLAVAGVDSRVAISETAPRENHGGALRLHELLDTDTWDEHLQRAGATWLLPVLRRLADGEDVGQAEVHALFRDRHGREPECYEWDTA
jgi:hypothetical protein